MYPVVPMSTTKVLMEIISTFVGYNVLHTLIVWPQQRESCSSLNSTRKRKVCQCNSKQKQHQALMTMMTTMHDQWSITTIMQQSTGSDGVGDSNGWRAMVDGNSQQQWLMAMVDSNSCWWQTVNNDNHHQNAEGNGNGDKGSKGHHKQQDQAAVSLMTATPSDGPNHHSTTPSTKHLPCDWMVLWCSGSGNGNNCSHWTSGNDKSNAETVAAALSRHCQLASAVPRKLFKKQSTSGDSCNKQAQASDGNSVLD